MMKSYCCQHILILFWSLSGGTNAYLYSELLLLWNELLQVEVLMVMLMKGKVL
jgi:hypothetical protein